MTHFRKLPTWGAVTERLLNSTITTRSYCSKVSGFSFPHPLSLLCTVQPPPSPTWLHGWCLAYNKVLVVITKQRCFQAFFAFIFFFFLISHYKTPAHTSNLWEHCYKLHYNWYPYLSMTDRWTFNKHLNYSTISVVINSRWCLPISIDFCKHSQVVFTRVLVILLASPISKVSFKSPWKPRW